MNERKKQTKTRKERNACKNRAKQSKQTKTKRKSEFSLFHWCSFSQVDLHFLKVLTGIATQGAISKETQKSYYVTTFKLEVSTNGEDWMMYRHGKNHKVSKAKNLFIFAHDYNESWTARKSKAWMLYCWELKLKECLWVLLKPEGWLKDLSIEGNSFPSCMNKYHWYFYLIKNLL